MTILLKGVQMGEASRRGSFNDRREQAVTRNKERMIKSMEDAEKADKDLTKEERDAKTKARLSMLSFMAFMKRSGLSMKEVKRAVKRKNKRFNKT
jgi:hypothetical protein